MLNNSNIFDNSNFYLIFILKYKNMVTVLKKRILELFNSGLSYDQISKQLRCSKGTISYHCSKLIKNDYTPELLKKYQDYYDQGNSIKKTATNFKLTRQTLAKKLNLRGNQTSEYKVIIRKNYRALVKKKAVEYKGGECERCGYNKCMRALDFHHLNPKEKDFAISGGTKSFESLKAELDKCILVCRNCHSEIHEKLQADIYPRPDTT